MPSAPVPVGQVTVGGLEESVTITPVSPKSGDVLTITSVVVNRRILADTVTSRVCGLDTQGTLTLTSSAIECLAYSMRGPLSPGDSVMGFDARTVASGPGHYTLRVRHLLDPEAWVTVPVDVR